MSKKIIPPYELELFRQTVGPVQRIESNRLHLTPDKKPPPRPRSSDPDYASKLDSAREINTETVSNEDTLNYLSFGLQKKVLKKLRQGQYGMDAELDLHGLTSQHAKQHLLKFLHHCVEEGYRCVHIIHGKGYRSADNHPVLKNHLNLWLRQHQDVQAFCSATPRDGGAGAVLVLLKISDKYRDSLTELLE